LEKSENFHHHLMYPVTATFGTEEIQQSLRELGFYYHGIVTGKH